MGRINSGELINWQNGQIMTAEKLKQDREIMVTAINDNHDNITEIQDNLEVPEVFDENWDAIENQDTFTLSSGKTYTLGRNLLQVVVEGFELVEGEEFVELTNNSFRLASPVSAGTRVYAKWYNIRTLKLFTEDLQAYTIMGVF